MGNSKAKLHLDEHFILRNIGSVLPKYALFWICAIAASFTLAAAPFEQPVTDYAGLRAFAVAFLTISVTTVTFAIPTCMRTIFAAYEQYYSTKIHEILLMRFPVTLLAISAFTSLVLSLLIVSGLIGISLPLSSTHMFYISLFWTVVCLVYLFVALEKLIYFVVKAPYAVLDKLEYGVSNISSIENKEDYAKFRRELAGMNDIAATIISKSTGQDDAITKVLDLFRDIHKHFLEQAAAAPDEASEKLALSACRAVDHEIVRIFRISASSRNEQAARNILKTYCGMISDAMALGSGIWYFTDMLSQIERMQSYADFTSVGEIKSLTYTGWFFMLADRFYGSHHDSRKYTVVVQALSSALRRATVASHEETITKFLRIASNSELDYDIPNMPSLWQTMLDRAVFVYTVWLIDAMPANAEKYLDYVKKYSSTATSVFRRVLPDSPERLGNLVTYENMVMPTSNAEDGSDTVAKSVSSDKVVLAMSMSNEDNAAHTIAMLMLLYLADMDVDVLRSFGRSGQQVADEVEDLLERCGDDDVAIRIELVEKVVPSILDKIGGDYAAAE